MTALLNAPNLSARHVVDGALGRVAERRLMPPVAETSR